jgi:hypothetical protein
LTTTLERDDLADTRELGPLPLRTRRLHPIRRLLGLIRAHPGFTGVFVFGAAIRALAVVAYRPALLFFGDSYTYLWMSHTLKADPTRPIAYPLFIRMLSWAPFGHNLAFLIIVQHLMGLGIGVLIYALARRYRLPGWAATLAAAPILLDAYQVNIEHFVMAEVLFQALIVCALAFLLWDERPSGPFCAFAGGLLALAGLSRTVGLVLIPIALLFLFLRRVNVARIVAFVMVAAAVVGGFSLWSGHTNTHGQASAEGYFLYGRVMSFADCTQFDVPPNELGLCDTVPVADRPNANFYVWGQNAPSHLVPVPKGMKPDQLLRSFALNAIFGQPVEYARTVAGDFIHYFRPGHISGRLDEPGAQWRFPRALDHRQYWDQAVRVDDDSVPVIASGPASVLRGYQGLMFPDGPFFAVMLVLGVAGAWLLIGRPSGGPLALIVAIAIALLAVPLMTTMFDYRYFLPAIPFISLAGAFGAHAIWERAPSVGARAALIGGAAIFIGGISLAFALSAAPAATATKACASVDNLGFGTRAVLVGAKTQRRSQSAYLQEMYQAAADRQAGSITRGGTYSELWQRLNDASTAVGNEFTIERQCLRHPCGSKRVTPAKLLARGKRDANVAMRAVHQFCGQNFPASEGANAGRRKGLRAPTALPLGVLPDRSKDV